MPLRSIVTTDNLSMLIVKKMAIKFPYHFKATSIKSKPVYDPTSKLKVIA
jgi:hypothetical protein